MKKLPYIFFAAIALLLLGFVFYGWYQLREKPLEYPPIDSIPLKKPSVFFDAGIWNKPIPQSPQLDEHTEEFQNILTHVVKNHGITLSSQKWTAPVYVANAETPRYNVALTIDWAPAKNMVLTNVPIPDYAQPDPAKEGLADLLLALFTSPADIPEIFKGDSALTIIDPIEGYEYGFWQARQEDGQWVASWGSKIPLSGTGIYECGLSNRGSGAALSAGLIWPEELVNEYIDHKIFFSFPYNDARGPVPPFTESDGLYMPDELAKELNLTEPVLPLPEGAIVQLDPSLDLNTLRVQDPQTGENRLLKPYEKTIARAMQEYGMVNIDNSGGVLQLYAVNAQSYHPSHYPDILPNDEFIIFPTELAEHFRVLDIPDPIESISSLSVSQLDHYQCDGKRCEIDDVCKQ